MGHCLSLTDVVRMIFVYSMVLLLGTSEFDTILCDGGDFD